MPIYPIDLVNGDPEGLNRHSGTRRRSSPGSPSFVGSGFYAVPQKFPQIIIHINQQKEREKAYENTYERQRSHRQRSL